MTEKCARCTRTKYEHHDHAHRALTDLHGVCPFGDCGDFTAAACHDCGCSEDDHRFGAAYQRLVAEDNGARRDGPNPCLNCLNCGRSGE